MLRVYETSLELLAALRPIIEVYERRDRNLAIQLRKAATSIPLHIAEGSFARGMNRAAKYQIGCSEARESLACCAAGAVMGYIEPIGEPLKALFREVIGTLVKNIRRG